MLKDCKVSVTEHGDNNHYESKAVYMHDRACKTKIAKQAQFWVNLPLVRLQHEALIKFFKWKNNIFL